MENKSAFPIVETNQTSSIETGMSLRDYFAAKALSGLLSAWGAHAITDYNELAHDAYMAADAMLKAREK